MMSSPTRKALCLYVGVVSVSMHKHLLPILSRDNKDDGKLSKTLIQLRLKCCLHYDPVYPVLNVLL